MEGYKVNDRVISSCEFSPGKIGVIWKITDEAVHVRFDDGMFQKFHFKPYHHKQTRIELLTKSKQSNG